MRHAAVVAEMFDHVVRHFGVGNFHLVRQLLQHEPVRLVAEKIVHRIHRNAGVFQETFNHRRHFGLHEIENGRAVHEQMILGPEVVVADVLQHGRLRRGRLAHAARGNHQRVGARTIHLEVGMNDGIFRVALHAR